MVGKHKVLGFYILFMALFLMCSLSVVWAAPSSFAQMPVSSVAITTSPSTPSAGPSDAPETDASQPRLVLKKYELSEPVLSAGSKITVTLTFQNIGKVTAHSVYVKVQSEGDLLPADHINRHEVGQIAPQKNKSISIPLIVQTNAKPGAQKLSVSFEYANAAGEFFSASEEILCPIKQPLRLSCDTPSIPEHGYAGDTLSVPVNVMNLGQSSLCNVQCTVEGPGLAPQSSLFLGTIEQGNSKNGEIFVFLGPKDTSDTSLYGQTQGTLKIIYEDEYGTAFDQSVSLPAFTIDSPRSVPTAMPDSSETPSETADQWWVTLVVLLVLLGGMLAWFIYQRCRSVKGRHDESH